MNGWIDLRVSVACNKCGVLLYSEVVSNYQTKGGRFEKGHTIKKDAIGSHLNCALKEGAE